MNIRESAGKACEEALCIGICSKSGKCDRNKHNRLSEDDWHHTGGIHLQWYILACTAILLVAHNAFCVLYGHLACSLYQENCTCNHSEKKYDLHEEHHQTSLCGGQAACELLYECSGEAGNNTHKDDERDTVADTLIGDLLTQPHDKH